MKIIANRRIVVGRSVFNPGDEVHPHEVADKLLRYGFADTEVPASHDDAPADVAPKKTRGK